MTDTNETTPEESRFVLGDKLYDRLKFLVTIVLPAFATFYFTIGDLWDLPNVNKVTGTILAVTTFLGIVLGVSNRAYKNSPARYDGTAIVTIDELGDKTFAMEFDGDPYTLDQKDSVTFKVTTSTTP